MIGAESPCFPPLYGHTAARGIPSSLVLTPPPTCGRGWGRALGSAVLVNTPATMYRPQGALRPHAEARLDRREEFPSTPSLPVAVPGREGAHPETLCGRVSGCLGVCLHSPPT